MHHTIPSTILSLGLLTSLASAGESPFTGKYTVLERASTGEWWKHNAAVRQKGLGTSAKKTNLNVARDEVLAFALYTHHKGSLKLSAQLFPLMPDESRDVRLEFFKEGKWTEVQTQKIIELGWSAHFRIDNWDNSQTVKYRVLHGKKATFEGTIRKDPKDKKEIVVANLSCNSSREPGLRPSILKGLIAQDPDLLFFAGDQTYWHTEHTAGWLAFGLQFRDVMKDRPTVTIPDDHDIGQANLWGESGIVAKSSNGPSGGYYYPPTYVNMVQRQQTWHLPDPYDPTPIKNNIGVYYTSLVVGGIDFAILEDRKFKSGPQGKIPKMGPRPDHINDPKYNRKSVDVAGLSLLGDRQLNFLATWSQDWTNSQLKVVLSQTPFCGAVHRHGKFSNKLLADLDSNAWPQTGRNKALTEIRKARATHLCGDQHLAVVVKQGIENPGDGPMTFSSPALVNTIYGRWWNPDEEKAGPNAIKGSALPWTGDYLDGLGNHIRMYAYANPENRNDVKLRGDGFGIVRFNKITGDTTFECFKRFPSDTTGKFEQYDGWPINFNARDNDGRKPVAHLPALAASGVVQVINNATKEILYTIRAKKGFQPPVYAKGNYSVKFGKDTPSAIISAISISEVK